MGDLSSALSSERRAVLQSIAATCPLAASLPRFVHSMKMSWKFRAPIKEKTRPKASRDGYRYGYANCVFSIASHPVAGFDAILAHASHLFRCDYASRRLTPAPRVDIITQSRENGGLSGGHRNWKAILLRQVRRRVRRHARLRAGKYPLLRRADEQEVSDRRQSAKSALSGEAATLSRAALPRSAPASKGGTRKCPTNSDDVTNARRAGRWSSARSPARARSSAARRRCRCSSRESCPRPTRAANGRRSPAKYRERDCRPRHSRGFLPRLPAGFRPAIPARFCPVIPAKAGIQRLAPLGARASRPQTRSRASPSSS